MFYTVTVESAVKKIKKIILLTISVLILNTFAQIALASDDDADTANYSAGQSDQNVDKNKNNNPSDQDDNAENPNAEDSSSNNSDENDSDSSEQKDDQDDDDN